MVYRRSNLPTDLSRALSRAGPHQSFHASAALLSRAAMKLSAAFALFPDLRFAVQTALWPTIVTLWRNPFLLFRPRVLSQTFMSYLWVVFGNGVDENGRPVKRKLITPYAAGVVLDLGAGTKEQRLPSTKIYLVTTRPRSHPQLLGPLKSNKICRSRAQRWYARETTYARIPSRIFRIRWHACHSILRGTRYIRHPLLPPRHSS